MAIDPYCLSEEQQQHLNELLTACRFIVEVKRLKMPGSNEAAISYGIDQIAGVLKKIDNNAA